MKYFFSFLILMLTSGFLFSQNHFYYNVSEKVLNYGFSDINKKISDQYPVLDDYVFEFSLGKHYVSDKGAFGLNISYLFNNKYSNGKKTEFNGYGISSNIEYNLFRLKSIRFYTLFDIALRKYNLSLTNANDGGFLFSEILDNEVDIYKFSNIGFYFDAGLGINYFFDLWVYNLGVGISGGIRQNAGNSWKYEDVTEIEGKLVRTNGFFIGLNFYLNLNLKKHKSI